MANDTQRPNDVEPQLRAALGELEHRLCTGALDGGAEELRDVYPAVWNDADAALELVYAEYVFRAGRGEHPARDDWYRRYPPWRDRLERLFALYDAMTDGANLAETGQYSLETDDVRFCPLLPGPTGCPAGYELIGEIGRGGMGIVYKARQVALNRVVAVKMLRGGILAGEDDTDRIRREAEAAARLQHPNIVQIHEVGDTGGVPFLCLEYVAGGSLEDTLARSRRPGHAGLAPVDAARLVETLARAMAAAHTAGVVHRDLKPANVLLAEDGTPKITDFGLATVVDDPGGTTRTGVIVGTPCYMAPEQAVADRTAVGPRADVYALGGILYTLLTGRPPFEGSTALETLEQVRHTDPVPPRRLRPGLPRDLETICLKCLEKAPARRYAGAADLADDLRRFLAGEPIRARPQRPWVRGVKWARRRPAVAALVGVVVLAAAAGAAGLVWHDLRVREEQRETRAMLLASLQTMEEICTPIWENDLPRDPRAEREERLLLGKALRLYESFGRTHAADRILREHTAKAYRATGRIQEHLGNPVEAQAAYRRAAEITRELAKENPGVPVHRQELATDCHRLGAALLVTVSLAEAEEALRESESLVQGLRTEFPNESKHRQVLADIWRTTGSFLTATGRDEEAEAFCRRSADLAHELAGENPAVVAPRQTEAKSLHWLGTLLIRRDKLPEARDVYLRALNLSRRLHKESPTNPHHRLAVASHSNSLGILFRRTGQSDEAELAFGEALALSRGLAEEYPTVPDFRSRSISFHCNLAALLRTAGRDDAGGGHYQEALGYCRNLVRDHPDVVNYHAQLGFVLTELGVTARARGDLTDSRRRLEEAVTLNARLRDHNRRNRTYQSRLRTSYWELAETLLGLKDREQLARVALKAPQVFPDEWDDERRAAHYLGHCRPLAYADTRLSRAAAAAAANGYTEQALRLFDEAIARNPAEAGLWQARAMHQASLGRWAGAADDYAKAAELTAGDPEVLANLGPVLLLAGRTDAYRNLCRQARGGRETDPRPAYLIARIGTLTADPSGNGDRDLRLAAQAVRAEPNLGWNLHVLGMAHLRAGQYEQAVARLHESDAGFWNEDGKVCNWAALAVAHHRMGQHAEARRYLRTLTEWMDKAIPTTHTGALGILPMHPHNWFACLVLRGEAEALLAGSKP